MRNLKSNSVIFPASVLGYFQEGGEIASGTPPEMQGEQDPLAQIMQMAMQAVEAQDANMALQVCQMLVEFAAQAQGATEAPAEAPMEEPMPVE